MDITNLISAEQVYLGAPTVIENVGAIYPKKLKEIGEIGATMFYSYLNFFTLKKEDVAKFLEENNNGEMDLTVFQFHLAHSHYDKEYMGKFEQAFKFFFLVEEVFISFNEEAIVLGNIKDGKIIKEEEFELISKIIAFQNNVDVFDSGKAENPSDAKAAEILRKIREGKEKRNRKKKKEENLTFLDLVASLAAKGNGLNSINVWDLTYYAFNDQFKRMQMIEEYDNARESLLAGADPKKVKLKNWLRPVKNEE